MATPLWLVDLIKDLFPYRNPIAGVTRVPVLGEVIDRVAFDGDNMVYLPHDRVVIDHKFEAPESMVLPSAVVNYFIEQASYHWIMKACLCRQAEQCQDYPQDLGCLFLGEAVLKINPRLGRLVTKEEALAHEQRCREAGLVHLIGRDRIDSMWLGVRPSSRLLTICNCCPCCCLFRVLPRLRPSISQRITRMPGVQLSVSDDCTGCGRCTRGVCFVDAIHVEGGRAQINADCRACGRCVEACPHGAIQLSVTDTEYVERTIQQLSASVRVG